MASRRRRPCEHAGLHHCWRQGRCLGRQRLHARLDAFCRENPVAGLPHRRAFFSRRRASRARAPVWNREKMPIAKAAGQSGRRTFRRSPSWSWPLPGRQSPAGRSAMSVVAASSGERNRSRSSCGHVTPLRRDGLLQGALNRKVFEEGTMQQFRSLACRSAVLSARKRRYT